MIFGGGQLKNTLYSLKVCYRLNEKKIELQVPGQSIILKSMLSEYCTVEDDTCLRNAVLATSVPQVLY